MTIEGLTVKQETKLNIVIDSLYKTFGATAALENINLQFRGGEFITVLGASGCGKTTLLHLLAGLTSPTKGNIYIDGEIKDQPGADRVVVFQQAGLFPWLSVEENIEFGPSLHSVPKVQRRKDSADILRIIGLESFARHKPYELSGGMQQRVGLARALAVNPSLMIMDEAFSALDPLKRKEMQNVLLELQKNQQRTILFVSHDLEEALRIGSRIAIMEGGRVVQIGTPQDIIANPADDYVRAFFEGVDTSRYLTAGDLMQANGVPVVRNLDHASVAESLNGSAEYAFVLDGERRIRGFVTRDSIGSATPSLNKVECISRGAPLEHVVSRVCASATALPVVDDEDRYCGSVDQAAVLKVITRNRGAAHV